MKKMKDEELELNRSKENETNCEVGHETTRAKILKVLKTILLAITSPVWFPWKVLFVRKKGNKFSDVSTGKKIFRLVRSPITKTLKLALFLCIIGIEVLLIYKVRYSIMTYPLTRSSAREHYLKDELPEDYSKELSTAFDHIDDWDLDSKNKMYVILDSEIVKMSLEHTDDNTAKDLFNKFNENAEFREDVRYATKNINDILSRAVKELPSSLDSDELNTVLEPLATVGSSTIDYKVALDVLGATVKTYAKEEGLDDEKIKVDSQTLDSTIDMIINYSKGMSLKEAYYKSEENRSR